MVAELSIITEAAEGVEEGVEANIPLKSASQPIDPAFERLMNIRRVRYFPISFASLFLILV